MTRTIFVSLPTGRAEASPRPKECDMGSLKSWIARIAASMAALACCACSPGKPPPPPAADQAAAARVQQAEFVQAMKPTRAGRPVIAVLALNDATETTDLLLPHAVLTRADVADVIVVAPHAGTVRLYPALQVQAEMDFARFEQAHLRGADYVVVPAMEPRDDAAVAGWLRSQHERGARVVGVCAGALVVAQAGLLDHRRYASHWYYQADVSKARPGATYVPHRRYVVDGDVATTTGISASVPMTIALVEAIAGPQRARALADEIGVADWTPAHDSSRFGLNAERRWSYIVDKLAFWRREQRAVDVRDGSDDIALALVADAWSRTGLVQVRAAAAASTVRLRSGLVLTAGPAAPGALRVAFGEGVKPVRQLDRTLCEIDARFGPSRRDRVEQEMEYPRGDACAG
jgi:putative intracellular protease/amidase